MIPLGRRIVRQIDNPPRKLAKSLPNLVTYLMSSRTICGPSCLLRTPWKFLGTYAFVLACLSWFETTLPLNYVLLGDRKVMYVAGSLPWEQKSNKFWIHSLWNWKIPPKQSNLMTCQKMWSLYPKPLLQLKFHCQMTQRLGLSDHRWRCHSISPWQTSHRKGRPGGVARWYNWQTL